MAAELRTSVWEKEFIKDFYPDSTFLKYAEDKTAMVNNNTINLVESGANPEVLIDNVVFPIPIVEQADTPYEVVLQRFSTENTVIRDLTQAARKQNLRAEAMKAHKRNIALKHMKLAAHNFSLSTVDAAKGNVIVPTKGADRGDGVKAATFENILEMGEVWDGFDIPDEARHIVLSIEHLTDLKKEDLKRYESLMKEIRSGKFSNTFGAYIHRYSQNPYFNRTTDAKLAFEAAVPADHSRVTFGFIDSEVLRAFGTTKMFANLNDAEAEGDIFHFANRFICVSKRNKFKVVLASKNV